MKVREFIVNQKEIVVILALISGLGAASKATQDLRHGVTPDVSRVDTLAMLATDVRELRAAMVTMTQTVAALTRVQCVVNRGKWESFETAGIRCGELIPSATQAGRAR
jgi:hypothetical protein